MTKHKDAPRLKKLRSFVKRIIYASACQPVPYAFLSAARNKEEMTKFTEMIGRVERMEGGEGRGGGGEGKEATQGSLVSIASVLRALYSVVLQRIGV